MASTRSFATDSGTGKTGERTEKWKLCGSKAECRRTGLRITDIPAYIQSYPDRPYTVLGYLDATTAPIRNWVGGPVAFAAQRAKELSGDLTKFEMHFPD